MLPSVTPTRRPVTAPNPSREAAPASFQLEPLSLYKSASSVEVEERRLMVSQQRSLNRLAPRASCAELRADRRHRAKAVRQEWDAHTGKSVTALSVQAEIRGSPPATEEEVTALSMALNVAACQLYPDARTQAIFFSLFNFMDHDGSGLVDFVELQKMVRSLLRIPKRTLSDDRLRAVWRWIDEDASGMIRSGEFNRLMRKGWDGFKEECVRRERRGVPGSSSWVPAGCEKDYRGWSEAPWLADDTAQAHKAEYYLIEGRREAQKNARKLRETRHRFEVQERAWARRLEALEGASRERLPAASRMPPARPICGSKSVPILQ